MGIQLVALDMDGTVLLDDHLTVTPAVRRSIEQALAKGSPLYPPQGGWRLCCQRSFMSWTASAM